MKSKTTLRQLAFAVSVFYTFSFTPKIVLASHNAGGELTYTHLTGNVYRLHVAYYRDCFGIPAPGSITLNVFSANCNVSQVVVMNAVANTGLEITLPCAGVLTTCLGGNAPGMQKWEYETEITLQGQCSDWQFSFSDCCRNAASTTLQNPGSEALYLEAHLNNLNGDNNSPQFINDPLIFSCVDQDFHYNNGMFDADGDSLVYHLVCARSAANTCVNYFPPHTAQQPFISNPPVTFDFFTGDYFMHPTAVEAGPVVFEILDYRNGELMGSVVRDVMMYTSVCANQNPTATEMNGTTQQIAYIYPTDTICFDIFSDDTDVADSLTLTWNQVIPAATFITTNAMHPTGTFCWVPTINDVRSQPYMFTAKIQDDCCPLNNAGVYSYYIYVTLDSSLIILNSESSFEEHLHISIFPNPSEGVFTVQSTENFSELKIFNALGVCVLQKDFEFEKTIDLSAQPEGIYFVEVIMQGGKMVRRSFVKTSLY